jgi:phosphoribosylanthranilate isomerase
MKAKVKICGITNWRDAKLAIDAGAELLGFNFYLPSPRYITPVRARAIVRRLPRQVKAVGVFVNDSPQDLADLAALVGLDWVQLHGDEPPADAVRLARLFPVLKAFRVRPGFRLASLGPYRRPTSDAGFLLDGFRAGLRGGTGKSFDWSLAHRAKRYGRVFLAGGLKPENVAQAIRAAAPYAVDVCSGIESVPGRKDPHRLRALMDAVEAANRKQ